MGRQLLNMLSNFPYNFIERFYFARLQVTGERALAEVREASNSGLIRFRSRKNKLRLPLSQDFGIEGVLQEGRETPSKKSTAQAEKIR
jgi:hypothetical protein